MPDIEAFLRQHFHPDSRLGDFLGGGVFSQAYAFDTPAGAFVIRIGENAENFRKDKLAYHLFTAPDLPIPRVFETGQIEGRQYAVSKRMPGQRLSEQGAEAAQSTLPSLLRTADALRLVKLPSTTGFGILDGTGKARHAYRHWRDYVLGVHDWPATFTARAGETYRNWDALFAETFLEKPVFEEVFAKMRDLSRHCPNEKHLVHGDFGYDNVLSENGQITAVLDWAEMRCGDFLYDIAYLDYYDTPLDYTEAFGEHYASKKLSVPHFAERIQCYKLHIFLGNVFLEANRNQRDWYEEDLARLPRLLNG